MDAQIAGRITLYFESWGGVNGPAMDEMPTELRPYVSAWLRETADRLEQSAWLTESPEPVKLPAEVSR